jgi:ribosome assembly protein YihI (activator of Der GTPase)
MNKHYSNTNNPIDFPKVPRTTKEEIERLEREAKKPKKRKGYAEIADPDGRKDIKSNLGYSRVGMWGKV